MKVIVTVLPKPTVLDPQGGATAQTLQHLGFNGIGRVRIGKVIEMEIQSVSEAQLHEVCRDFLSNPVIEDYTLQVVE